MDPQVSQQKIQQADGFFKEGRHEEALTLLLELNKAHPNAKNILYPMALCYQNLGRGAEAIPICNHLVQHHQGERAHALKQRIESESLGGRLSLFGAKMMR